MMFFRKPPYDVVKLDHFSIDTCGFGMLWGSPMGGSNRPISEKIPGVTVAQLMKKLKGGTGNQEQKAGPQSQLGHCAS